VVSPGGACLGARAHSTQPNIALPAQPACSSYLDLSVSPLGVRAADEGRDVAEEDDERAEDDNLLVEDEELLRDGSGRDGRGEDDGAGL